MFNQIYSIYIHKYIFLLGVSLEYPQSGTLSILFTAVSPASIIVPGTCKISINICWINKWINLDAFLQGQIAFFWIPKMVLSYKMKASLDGNKTIATSLVSHFPRKGRIEWDSVLWETGRQLTSAQIKSVFLMCAFPGKRGREIGGQSLFYLDLRALGFLRFHSLYI